jgi:DNA invertase Pin-like site-specific DNA recombinase
MNIGYVWVSTGEQTLDLQLDALRKAGCGTIYQETTSGATAERPVLAGTLGYLRTGDTLVVWRLDRLGCSLKHLIETVSLLAERGAGRVRAGRGPRAHPGRTGRGASVGTLGRAAAATR